MDTISGGSPQQADADVVEYHGYLITPLSHRFRGWEFVYWRTGVARKHPQQFSGMTSTVEEAKARIDEELAQ